MLDALRNQLCKFAQAAPDAVFNLRDELTLFAADFIIRLTLGEDADGFDFEKAISQRIRNGKLYLQPSLWDSVPFLGKTVLRQSRQQYMQYAAETLDHFRGYVKRRQATFDASADPRDVLDVLLQRMAAGEISEDTVVTMLTSDFFTAGTDTSTASLEWVIGHLFYAPPEKMARVQRELDALNVAPTQLLRQADLTPEAVPYLYAAIKETFR